MGERLVMGLGKNNFPSIIAIIVEEMVILLIDVTKYMDITTRK